MRSVIGNKFKWRYRKTEQNVAKNIKVPYAEFTKFKMFCASDVATNVAATCTINL